MRIKRNKNANMQVKKHAKIVMTAGIEETETLAYTCKAICEKKNQAWQKEQETKGISQSIRRY